MLPAERRNHILIELQTKGKIEIEVLASELNVSPMTIRRDLAMLEEQGLAHRTHGGAVLYDSLLGETPYNTKEISNIEEKRRIGKAAAEFVKDGSVIILDAGTTTLEVARVIKHIRNLTVITNDLKIALELSEGTETKVYCMGGQVQNGLGTIYGEHAQEFLSKIRVDTCFIATSSIDIEWGLSSPTIEKANLKRLMMRAADQVVLVADHSKFYKKSFARIAKVDELDIIITDQVVEDSFQNILKDKGVQTGLSERPFCNSALRKRLMRE
jgi:DeoR/GlpR family transcriptional regulator of sugar metabolism